MKYSKCNDDVIQYKKDMYIIQHYPNLLSYLQSKHIL